MKKISNLKGCWVMKFYAYIRTPLSLLLAFLSLLTTFINGFQINVSFILGVVYTLFGVLFLVKFFRVDKKTVLYAQIMVLIELLIFACDYIMFKNMTKLIGGVIVTLLLYYFGIHKKKNVFENFEDAVSNNEVELINNGTNEGKVSKKIQTNKPDCNSTKKTIISVVIAALAVLILFVVFNQCNVTKSKTTVCTMNYEGVNVENTLVSKGNKVQSIKYVNSITVDETLLPYLQVAAEDFVKKMSGVEGLSYNWSVDSGTLTETTDIDYTKVDLSALVNLGLLEKVDGEVPTYIDLESSINNMKELGCTCSEK